MFILSQFENCGMWGCIEWPFRNVFSDVNIEVTSQSLFLKQLKKGVVTP